MKLYPLHCIKIENQKLGYILTIFVLYHHKVSPHTKTSLHLATFLNTLDTFCSQPKLERGTTNQNRRLRYHPLLPHLTLNELLTSRSAQAHSPKTLNTGREPKVASRAFIFNLPTLRQRFPYPICQAPPMQLVLAPLNSEFYIKSTTLSRTSLVSLIISLLICLLVNSTQLPIPLALFRSVFLLAVSSTHIPGPQRDLYTFWGVWGFF